MANAEERDLRSNMGLCPTTVDGRRTPEMMMMMIYNNFEFGTSARTSVSSVALKDFESCIVVYSERSCLKACVRLEQYSREHLQALHNGHSTQLPYGRIGNKNLQPAVHSLTLTVQVGFALGRLY